MHSKATALERAAVSEISNAQSSNCALSYRSWPVCGANEAELDIFLLARRNEVGSLVGRDREVGLAAPATYPLQSCTSRKYYNSLRSYPYIFSHISRPIYAAR